MIEQAREIAITAGKILMGKLESGFAIEHKGRIDLVTDADRAAEEYVVEQLTKAFPNHSILAEEGGWTKKANEFVWIIDPLDGTTNFAHGFPYFAVSLGLVREDEIVLGVVYNPNLDECFWAELGGGAYLNDKQIEVSSCGDLQSGLFATGFPYDIATTSDDNLDRYSKVIKVTQGVRCNGAAALDLCQVACGRLEAFWEHSLQPWDMAAGSLIVTEAGGKISRCNGQDFNYLGSDILASNGHVHDEMLELL